MKNFQQNLLMVLAAALCLLCAYQWYGQTLERDQVGRLNQTVFLQAGAIQNYTNSIATMDRQIAQLDSQIDELKQSAKANEETVAAQKRELNKLSAENGVLTNDVAQYKQAVDTLETKLKGAYDGIQKQNDAIKELVTQRDEFVQKLNASIKDRNDIVAKYNELAQQVEKLQGGGSGK